MKKIGIVGASGFIGGHLASRYKNARLYGRHNIAQLKEDDSDYLVITAAPAEKWLANSEPKKDLDNIKNLIDTLESIAHKTCVLISTIDVFPAGIKFSESQEIPEIHPDAYGANRGFLEVRLNELINKLYIIRLPGMFGPGLKKNLIYDLMNGNAQPKVNSSSNFQFYDVRWLPAHMELCLGLDLRKINLATEPVTVGEIYKTCFGLTAPTFETQTINYKMTTNYSMELAGREGPYILTKQEVLCALQQWISSCGKQ